MKQVLQDARSGDISVEEVPVPQLLPGCVLVRVAASVVSAGTERASIEFASKNLLQKAKSRPDLVRDVIGKIRRDGIFSALQAVRSRLDQPQTPGYSSAGTVIAVADGITDLHPGDRVACAGAGIAVHAEVACVPRLLAARIPAKTGEVPFEEAAFATLGAVALHGVRTAEVKLGDVVAVIGLGLLGQITVQLLKAAGCQVVGLDPNQKRAQLALGGGADAATSDASEFRDLCFEKSKAMGADAVLITAETSSSEPVNLAGAVARDRAIVVAVGTVGMEIGRRTYYEKELDFRISRSYGPGRYDTAYEQKGRDYPIGYVRWTETRNMEAFLKLVADGKVNVHRLITHRFPVERADRAYELISGKSREAFLGVVIEYAENTPLSTTLEMKQPMANRAEHAVSVGVLGAGLFASGTLIPAIKYSQETALIGVCAATGAHAQQAAKKFGFRYCTTNESELVADTNINTAVIATRHHLHAEQVRLALQHSKHVFCEKPLCLSEEELAAIVRDYRDAAPGCVLMVGFNRRFAPMAVRLKSFLQAVKEPLVLQYRINAGQIPANHWLNDPERGGGRVLGEVCHFADLSAFLAGSSIVEVNAQGLENAGSYSGDNVLISLRMANGSLATIVYLANGDRAFSKERIEVFGGGSSAVLEDFRRLELVRNGKKTVVQSRLRQDKGHRAEWAAFERTVRGERDCAIPFEEIVNSTLATLRIQQSAATGESQKIDVQQFIAAAVAQKTEIAARH